MARTMNCFDATIVDGASLFDATEVLSDRFGRSRVTVEYTKLRECLDRKRKDKNWRAATDHTIALSMDPNSEGQNRFLAMLQHSGFTPDIVHYRDAFISQPPGRTPSDAPARSLVSLAPRLAYIAGVMSSKPNSHFLLVSHSFELCSPLSNLASRFEKNGTGKVGLAYFSSLLDYRWKSAGLFDGKLGFDFFDLDGEAPEILGIDLIAQPRSGGDTASALNRF